MKRHIILSLLVFGSLVAQVQGQEPDAYAPEKGDVSLGVLFGRGNFLTSGLLVPSVPQPGWTVPGAAPYANFVSGNDNSASNIVGVEGRYFVADDFALKLSGGAIIRDTPSRLNVESTTDFSNTNNQAWIPNYESVEARDEVDANVTLGGEFHFDTKYSRVSPYTGLSVPFYYARRSLYDPAVTTAPNGQAVITDIGTRHIEIIGAGAQLVAGVDYYLLEGFFVGAEIKPVSYVYAYSQKSPGPGLENLESDTHTFSFLAQTFLKLGFRF